MASISKILSGFFAGVVATLTFHQVAYFMVTQLGEARFGPAWNIAANPAAFGLPAIVNLSFWGGLWGIPFAYLFERIPTSSSAVKGILYSMAFPMCLGGWIVVPLLKGRPQFAGAFANGFAPSQLMISFFLNGLAFGIGLGVIYRLLARADRTDPVRHVITGRS